MSRRNFWWIFILIDWITILSAIFGGCCSNAWSLESIMRKSPDCGILLTFAQFAAVTVYHLPHFLTLSSSWSLRFKARQVPLYDWAFIVSGFIAVNLLNNFAFKFKIPLPLHIVFRSSGLCVSMLLGFFVLRRRYTLTQIVCVAVVTAGTLITTAYSPQTGSEVASEHSPLDFDFSWDYVVGISMLALALILSGFMGINQEKLYAKYGSHTWPEMLFYSHSLAMPLIPFFLPNIIPQLRYFNKSTKVQLGESTIGIPEMHILLVANVFTQFLCITGVNKLTAKVSNLSVNLILTVRKAISLVFSIWWYGNSWNNEMTVGTLAVLVCLSLLNDDV
ncbi:UDP-xylose and UDP-N-acetylglucosamine transporter [Wallemia mellicola]|uniref:UDP-xylose and UDP-N-acetylglucosamine transporter n=2 Tax=Wallemia mellicola TaxID=1708541 RepID=A0A4T0M0C3_9BASI|nr:UDP-xylose and UDP-N-acetylglucosamine transporter [Wallemia mellicola CBS 633.66]TIB71507.1 hypothetical protein E3Q23_03756 [Wallemia mellicola]EIM21756.1 UDP-xylose and UDP-N-acetylglucosamine transporter [Wallemia mellicola CBS 633.66]TIB72392.1 hypothetical protein E3Q24_01738 [Wallemia mellicola]TIB75919.1 UDP-xylose and UDP-N-acetylglucosamine transporter [Wallemia mellicola]TIB82024.1 UDP-xylose and UDP-N-acetylglucosamine transporter [Wallemia mellicola]|eukprot:XP_006958030.1 UDP-xylose and UDP-N-acetylglucosamine transporter [Wallemia mellicola CBS 633.66]